MIKNIIGIKYFVNFWTRNSANLFRTQSNLGADFSFCEIDIMLFDKNHNA